MRRISLAVTTAIVFAASCVCAGELAPPPILSDASEVPVRISFTEPTAVSEIYRAVGRVAGIEVVFDPRLNERTLTLAIDTATTSEALNLVAAAANGLWVPTGGTAVLVAEDTPQFRREYEPLAVRSFALENGSVREAETLLRSIAGVHHLTVNSELRTLTVRESAAKMPIIERLVSLIDRARGEIDVGVELLTTGAENLDAPPPRFTSGEYASWRRQERVSVLASSSLGLIDGDRAGLHLGAVKGTPYALDLSLEGRVHPLSDEVTLEIRAHIAPTGIPLPDHTSDRPASARIETAVRLDTGSTILLRVPGAAAADFAIAITPTIVRAATFEPSELDAVWVGTESRIHASR